MKVRVLLHATLYSGFIHLVACAEQESSFSGQTLNVQQNIDTQPEQDDVVKIEKLEEPQAPSEPIVENIDDSGKLYLLDDAQDNGSGIFQLTYGSGSRTAGEKQRGGVISVQRFSAKFFELSLDFKIYDPGNDPSCPGFVSNPDGGPAGADGIKLTLTPDSLDQTYKLPDLGGALGVKDIAGIGVELDTYPNSAGSGGGLSDDQGDGNHIGIVKTGNDIIEHLVFLPITESYFNDGKVHHMKVIMVDQKMSVYYDNKAIVESFDTPFSAEDTLQFFLSAGVGCARNVHEVSNISVKYKADNR